APVPNTRSHFVSGRTSNVHGPAEQPAAYRTCAAADTDSRPDSNPGTSGSAFCRWSIHRAPPVHRRSDSKEFSGEGERAPQPLESGFGDVPYGLPTRSESSKPA